MRFFYYTLLLLISVNCFSQRKFSGEILTGIGGNKKLFLVNEEVKKYNVFTTQLNGSYKYKIHNKFYGETGLGMQVYYSFGEVGFSKFRSTTLRLNIPVLIGYSLSEKIDIGGGVVVSNNRDFKDIDFRERRNLRMSLGFKFNYFLNDYFSVLLNVKQNLRKSTDFTLVNQPNTDVSIGVAYKMF